MNIYTYWYFIIYSLYDRFSKDRHFDIFATGLFSLFVGFFLIGIFGIIRYLVNSDGIILDAKGAGYICVFSGIMNFIYFNKNRQRKLYTKFKDKRDTKKDITVVLVTLLSIVLSVIAVRLNMQ